MKSFTLIMISLLMLNTSFANEEKYIASMKQNIQALYDAQSIEQLLQTVNALDRIGSVEKDKWEPQYYKAFGLVLMANREMDAVKKDLYLDQALDAITKAKEIGPNESEVEAV
ncbi:MAG TPA: hypothetical protein VFW11_03260, partial [Cyclobacteriaceae bacterium]|nr:hypothetical protein [Cyclobacteriaceae bacterium]